MPPKKVASSKALAKSSLPARRTLSANKNGARPAGADAPAGGAPSATLQDPTSWIGQEVRSLRKAKGLSLQELATRCGKSVGFLSQIERGLSKPTVSALNSVAEALDVQINWFFPQRERADPFDEGVIVRKAKRRRLAFASGVSDYLLSPNLSGPLELLWSTMEPGADNGGGYYQHKGDEAGVVISGSLELWVGDQFFLLESGDSFSFPSSTPHRYRNPGSTLTEVVWVVTPPSY